MSRPAFLFLVQNTYKIKVKSFILAHGFRGFSPWSAGTKAGALWQKNMVKSKGEECQWDTLSKAWDSPNTGFNLPTAHLVWMGGLIYGKVQHSHYSVTSRESPNAANLGIMLESYPVICFLNALCLYWNSYLTNKSLSLTVQSLCYSIKIWTQNAACVHREISN